MVKNNSLHSKSGNRFIRNVNVSAIIRELRKGPASRSEIAQNTGLSRSALTDISSELLNKGLLKEVGEGESKGGRKPTLLDINPHFGQTLGVKIEVDRILVGVTDIKGNLKHKESKDFEPGSNPDEVISSLTTTLSSSYKLEKEGWLGMGVGVSGLISDKGNIIYSPILEWRDVDIQSPLEKKVGLPVWIENDVNSLTLAEGWFGAGKETDNFLCITVGEGIGMGIFQQGTLYRGTIGGAGELGHITIDPEGPVCRCGERGCLETLASDSFLRREINGLGSSIKSIEDLLQAARSGNPQAKRIFKDMGHNLGVGLKNIVNLFNPNMLILGGERMNAADHFLPSMKREVKKHSFPDEAKQLDIKRSALGKDGWLIGASTLPINNTLHPGQARNSKEVV